MKSLVFWMALLLCLMSLNMGSSSDASDILRWKKEDKHKIKNDWSKRYNDFKKRKWPTPEPTQWPTPEPTDKKKKKKDKKRDHKPSKKKHSKKKKNKWPTPEPTAWPTPEPTDKKRKKKNKKNKWPTPEPTQWPTPEPTDKRRKKKSHKKNKWPTPEPTRWPTPEPTNKKHKKSHKNKKWPRPEPTAWPTPEPTEWPTPEPTNRKRNKSHKKKKWPTPDPTRWPTPEPTGRKRKNKNSKKNKKKRNKKDKKDWGCDDRLRDGQKIHYVLFIDGSCGLTDDEHDEYLLGLGEIVYNILDEGTDVITIQFGADGRDVKVLVDADDDLQDDADDYVKYIKRKADTTTGGDGDTDLHAALKEADSLYQSKGDTKWIITSVCKETGNACKMKSKIKKQDIEVYVVNLINKECAVDNSIRDADEAADYLDCLTKSDRICVGDEDDGLSGVDDIIDDCLLPDVCKPN